MQLSLLDVAELFRVPENTVIKWVQKENLPAESVNSQYRFHRAELLEWATLQKKKFSPDLFRKINDDDVGEISLSNALQRGGITRNVGGTDKQMVLASVLDTALVHLPIPADFDQETLLNLFLSREKVGSTAVGDGIAIPHPYSPIVLPTMQPAVCLCFLTNPIDFSAVDGKPVDTMFVMVCPTFHDHLKLLAKLAALLRKDSFRKTLRPDMTDDQIISEAHRLEDSFRQEQSEVAI